MGVTATGEAWRLITLPFSWSLPHKVVQKLSNTFPKLGQIYRTIYSPEPFFATLLPAIRSRLAWTFLYVVLPSYSLQVHFVAHFFSKLCNLESLSYALISKVR